ncbi:50S ribosomal protein L18 [bacterium]|nr:50S ribosomal protein L18 [bacterium]
MLKNRSKIKAKIKYTNQRNNQKHLVGVFRSNLYTNAYLADPKGKVLVSFSSKNEKGTKSEAAFIVGKKVGEYISKNKITSVYFNRSGYLYHGRVKKVAEGAREAGVQF